MGYAMLMEGIALGSLARHLAKPSAATAQQKRMILLLWTLAPIATMLSAAKKPAADSKDAKPAAPAKFDFFAASTGALTAWTGLWTLARLANSKNDAQKEEPLFVTAGLALLANVLAFDRQVAKVSEKHTFLSLVGFAVGVALSYRD